MQANPIQENADKNRILMNKIPKCKTCNKKLDLVSGIVILNNKWYHSACKPREVTKLI